MPEIKIVCVFGHLLCMCFFLGNLKAQELIELRTETKMKCLMAEKTYCPDNFKAKNTGNYPDIKKPEIKFSSKIQPVISVYTANLFKANSNLNLIDSNSNFKQAEVLVFEAVAGVSQPFGAFGNMKAFATRPGSALAGPCAMAWLHLVGSKFFAFSASVLYQNNPFKNNKLENFLGSNLETNGTPWVSYGLFFGPTLSKRLKTEQESYFSFNLSLGNIVAISPEIVIVGFTAGIQQSEMRIISSKTNAWALNAVLGYRYALTPKISIKVMFNSFLSQPYFKGSTTFVNGRPTNTVGSQFKQQITTLCLTTGISFSLLK